MSARTSIWSTCRALAIRSRPIAPRARPYAVGQSRRWYADESRHNPSAQPLSSSQIPEEAQEVPAAEKGSLEPADQPAVRGAVEAAKQESKSPEDALGDELLAEVLYGTRQPPSGTDPGLTPAQQQSLYQEGTIPSPQQAEEMFGEDVALQEAQAEASVAQRAGSRVLDGFKFAPPPPLAKEGSHLKRRYHPVLEQITRLLMRDGKLSVAQRNLAMVMNFLRTSPEPIYSPKFPLLPGTPPASHLPLNPVLYITLAIDSVAPLIRIRNISGGAGGGRALEMPTPLAVRQRRRIAFQWILDSVDKKPSKGSGRKQFPHRLAEEIVAVIEGRSGVWEKRKQVHKLGTAARSNINSRTKVKKRK